MILNNKLLMGLKLVTRYYLIFAFWGNLLSSLFLHLGELNPKWPSNNTFFVLISSKDVKFYSKKML